MIKEKGYVSWKMSPLPKFVYQSGDLIVSVQMGHLFLVPVTYHVDACDPVPAQCDRYSLLPAK